MNILLGFEESQTECIEFRKKGHTAFSCDIKPASGSIPQYHIQDCFFKAVKLMKWDIIIIHPPCTYTALSGNRWYYNSPLRLEGAQLCKEAWEVSKQYSNKVCLEQPKTIMQKIIGPKTQVIHPWQFGHGEVKETWLWLHGLPDLKPSNIVEGREQRIWKMSNSPDRQTLRSKSYSGIACAMAEQWG